MSSKMNLLIHINAYQDKNATNNPTLNNFKWLKDIQGIDAAEPESRSLNLNSNQEVELFSGTVATQDDTTTEWNIALKTGTTNNYRISHASGTLPVFRDLRNTGADATTEITVTKNARLLTFTSTAGTPLDLINGGVQVGDEVSLGSVFNVSNRGVFKILSLTATSFTVENEIGVAETVVLGASFDDVLRIVSSDGVQIGDKVDIVAGFSSTTFGTYEIVGVSDKYIDIFSAKSLASESGVSNNPKAFDIYRDAKSFVYIQSDKKIEITKDGQDPVVLSPLKCGSDFKDGIYLVSSTTRSLKIKNTSVERASVFYVMVE